MGRELNPSFHWFLILSLLIVFSPSPVSASENELEASLQAGLEESRTWVERARGKQRTGGPFLSEIEKLKSLAGRIRPVHLLLQERFRLREEKIASSGGGARERHRMMAEGYRKALEEYLILIDGLSPPATVSGASLDRLQTLLDQILHKKKLPILGNLPYRNLRYASKDPGNDPPITPAYQGGNKSVSPDDLKTISSQAITVLAQSLSWNPVSIYEWVKNNIETEWYFGCMKGAEETLSQRGGNDCDQASLLVALLRAAGYPSRYVRGVIEFFPDIGQAKSLTGIGDERELASFFQKAGIPLRTVVAGGKISNIQIEHIWVESQVPYSNYRGAIIDAQGKTWIALDTSIKVVGYETNFPADLPPEPFFSQIRDPYLAALQAQTPLELIQSKLEDALSQRQPGKHYSDLLRRRILLPEVLNILPASLQFRQIKVMQEFTEIPPELQHQVRLIATDSNRHELLNVVLDAAQLSNRKAVLTYEPETVEDQETIDLHGGLDNTPAYLVRLRPVLKVNEERIAVAQDGLAMGSNYTFTVEMTSPNGTERFTTEPVAGNLSALGIVSQKAVLPAIPEAEKNPERLLYEEALRYIDRWGRAEEEMTSLMRLALSRPVPTLVMVGGVIDVSYLLDTPHRFEWKGVYVDAGLRAVEVGRSATTGDDLRKAFMQLLSLQGSVLEERIFKDDFHVESISTAKLLTLATGDAVPILNLDRTNFETILSTISFSEEIQTDLRNAVNQGLAVKIPSREITYLDWTGVGYLKEDIETGESGWMLSGGIAGGTTAQAPEGWVNQLLRDTLGAAYAGDSNKDPLSAASIIKIPTTDRQEGTVGKLLDQPLSVLVRDKDGLPVKGATVTFRIIAGGGRLGPVPGAATVTVITGRNGIAKAPLLLGQKTSDNPFYQKPNPTDLYYTQTGLNLVTAMVKSAGLEVSLLQPFEGYGLPGLPHHLVKILGEGNAGLVNNPAGSIKVLLADQYENPISNQMITFETVSATSDIALPEVFRSITFYRKEDCPNPYPLFGDCPTQASLIVPSQYFGAVVNTTLGNTVNTTYEVKASAASTSVAPAIFTLYSLGFRGQSGSYIPPALLMGTLAVVNDRGQPVNATKIGTELKAPLVSELFTLSDDYTMEGPYTCVKNNQPTSCYRIKTSDTVNIQRKADGVVTYTVAQGGGSLTPAENLGDGKYQSRYTAGITPSINQIEAGAVATINVPEVLYNPSTLQAITTDYEVSTLPTRTVSLNAGQSVRFDRDTRQPIFRTTAGNTSYTIYSVDVRLAVDPILVLLNDQGYTNDDITFNYIILPPEYSAISSQIDLFKTTGNSSEIWQGYIPGGRTQTPRDQSGEFVEGTAVLVRGSQFDSQSRYQAEAVVNRGSDMEVRSGIVTNGAIKRSPVIIGYMQFLDDQTLEPVIGGASDGVTKLRFRLIVKEGQELLPQLSWSLTDPDLPNQTVAMGTLLDINDQPASIVPVVFNVDGIAETVYRVPETFVRFGSEKETQDKDQSERAIQVMLNDITRGVPSIKLRRPPVLLVHGLWGSGDRRSDNYTWRGFQPLESGNNGKFRIVSVDYHSTNAHGFGTNVPYIRKGMEKGLNQMKDIDRYAVTKVDIIAHSMGGLITREYCMNNTDSCKKQIHKLITIDSPHRGSELADILIIYRDRRDLLSNSKNSTPPYTCYSAMEAFVNGTYNLFGVFSISSGPHPIDRGAVDDLASGRWTEYPFVLVPGGKWQVLPNLDAQFFAHTVVSIATPPGLFEYGHDPLIIKVWGQVLGHCNFFPERVFGNQGSANDGIVTRSSQEGRLVNLTTQEITAADHFSVLGSTDENGFVLNLEKLTEVTGKIEELLEAPVLSSLFTTGPTP